jgi:aspartate carbamoyltransferase regulatory subunit
MCDKCKPTEHKKYWVHIADAWIEEERREMLAYLSKKARANIVKNQSLSEEPNLDW